MSRSFTLRVDGQEYEIEQQGQALLVNGKRFEPRIEGETIKLGAIRHTVELDGERAVVDGIARDFETEGLLPAEEELATAGSVAAGAGALTAIMPGLIIKVPVAVGDAVSAGDVVVILEAMKMENEITAPHDGVVKEVLVKAGDSVTQNQILAVIE